MTKLNVLPQYHLEQEEGKAVNGGRFPPWLHRSFPLGNGLNQTGNMLSNKRLHTVCEEAKCPNRFECWSNKTATFLIMGKECTRNCGFCSIDFSKTPKALDADEPERVAEAVLELGLAHVVVTMVARDDLPDGGSNHLASVLYSIKKNCPGVTTEVLTSDFNGNEKAWQTVLDASPEVFNYNIETVRRLTPRVRHKATYERTLSLLSYVAAHRPQPNMRVKSGFMVGLGESDEEVFETLSDLKSAGCEIATIGQYLQPGQNKLLVKAFIPPERFKKYEEWGYRLGFSFVYSGPFVRSSYNAHLGLL